MLMLLAATVLLAAAVYLASEVVTAPSRERHRALRRATDYGRIKLPGNALELARFRERVLGPLSQSFAKVALRLNPRVTMESIQLSLLSAGLNRTVSPHAFLAAKGAGMAVGAFLGLAVGGTAAGFGLGVFFAVAFGGIGFVLPGFVVSMKARQRREQIRVQLPDALDLLAVSVEAGLGFDGAVAKLTEHMEGALAEEFELTLGEMRIGEGRHDALKKLAERAAAPEIASFCRAIIQADTLGTSLGRTLRVQAIDSRLKRQAAAEEKAMKSPIKMLFPTVLFIFPAMFLVILGPALIEISKVF
jgi:tight adherence protein C